jgi:Ethanolamine utilization protein EutJ (predicted chaperonin)
MNKILSIILVLISIGFYQTANAQAELGLSSNLQCGTHTYCIDIELKANNGSFQLGTSSLLLRYNKDALTFSNYTAAEFSNFSTCVGAWSPQQFDLDADKGEFSLTMKLLDPNSSCAVSTSTKIIGTLCFTIRQQGASPDISFDSDFTHLNTNIPDNGINALTINNLDSIVATGVLACDCPGVGLACNDNNGFTTNDQFDINCNCTGLTLDEDGDGVADGVDPCKDVRYEAEAAYYTNGTFSNSYMQFYGNGYVRWYGTPTDTIKFSVHAVDTGVHQLAFRYSNGGTSTRSVKLQIDGALVNSNLLFPSTNTNWNEWDTILVNQYFTVGQHEILLTKGNTWNNLNFDRLTVSHCVACTSAGQWCDDNDSCTVLDIVDIHCNCAGVLLDTDKDGVCDEADICSAGDDNMDTDNDGTPDACDNCNGLLTNTSCNDGNPCTTNDVFDANCNCAGTAVGTDTDNDGVCDAFDVCANGDDNIDTDNDGAPDACDNCNGLTVGTPCNDGDPCTVLDLVQFDCSCAGVLLKLEATGQVKDVSCYNFDDGSITLSVTNGFGDINYTWSNGDSTSLIKDLAPNNYEVRLTDFRGCADTVDFNIVQPDSLMVNYNIVPSSGTNGSVDVTVLGGTTPYTYLWAKGETVPDLSNLSQDSYYLTVTDGKGCVTKRQVDIYPADMCVDTIIQAEDGILNLMGLDIWNERFALGKGFIYLTDNLAQTATYHFNVPADGFYTIGFRYSDQWATRSAKISIDSIVEFQNFDFPRTYTWANWQKIEFVDYLTAGTHQLEIAHGDDNWGPWIDFISICDEVVVPITLNATITNNVCYGESKGALTLLPTGGTRNYSILWSTGDTTATISNLAAGDYYVTATDEVNQVTVDTFTVGQPTEINPVFTITPVKCHGETNGRANVAVSGGTSGYSYLWSNGQTWTSTYNVAAGTYTLKVTDSKGCVKFADALIPQPDKLQALFDNTTSTGNDGTIDMTPVGGNAPYTFFWKDSLTTEDRTNLAVGHYRVTITDAKNCQLKTNTSIYPNGLCLDTVMQAEDGIYQNLSYNIWYPNTPVTGRGYISFSNDASGMASYTFDIAESGYHMIGFRYSEQSQDGKIRIEIDSVLEYLDFNLPRTYSWDKYEFVDFPKYLNAGTHTLTLKHRKNWSPRIDFISLCDVRLLGHATKTDLNCFGDSTGTATVHITNGSEPYQYLWSTGDTTSTITGLGIGTYTVSVTDNLNSVLIDTVEISQPLPVMPVIVGTDVDCNGSPTGKAVATVSGGTPNYSFAWNNNATTSTISNLAAGTYQLIATDTLGCIGTANITINEPLPLVATISASTDLNCHGNNSGAATITTSGGTGNYSYLWNNGNTQPSATNLAAGAYSVTVMDTKGCTDNISLTINQPTALVPTIVQVQNAACFGDATGQITTNTTGGTGNYTYAWSNNTSNSNLSNVSAGNYTLSVTDANNCLSTLSATITQPTAISSQITNVANVDCNGNANGSIAIVTAGGTGNPTFLWSNGATSMNLSNLSGGAYTVTITDANNCTSSLSATVQEPAVLEAQFSNVVHINCHGNANGAITTNTTGGTGNYSYLWSNGNTQSSATNLAAGAYSVTVMDAKSCTDTISLAINQPTALVPTIVQVQNAACFGDATGQITTNTTGGTGNYTYAWSNNTSNSNLSNVSAGNYTLSVTDANNCLSTVSATITQPTAISSQIANVTNVDCNGNANGSIAIATAGGTGNPTFLWSNGATTKNLSNLSGGAYTVTITDANNCTSTLSATVQEPAVLMAQFSNVIGVDCYGNANGTVTANATGGNGAYVYHWNNNASTAALFNLNGGNYSVVVTDALGCTATASILIPEPTAPLTLNYAITPSTGNNGSIDITASGGTPNYIFSWSDGINTQDRNNLMVGNYHLTITDANGCSENESFIIYDGNTCLDAIYHAEAATVNGANILNNTANGALGTGYTAFGSGTSQTVSFDISTTTDTVYEVSVRYAQGSNDKALEVSIDGVVVYPSLTFPKTDTWTTWRYLTFKRTLTAGAHNIQFRNIQGNGPDMDYISLCVTSPDTTTSIATVHHLYQPALRPYPNPTTSNLNLDIELANADEGTITIYDVSGRVMYQNILKNNGQAVMTTQVNVEQYAQGMYFVQLKTALGSVVKKITVLK